MRGSGGGARQKKKRICGGEEDDSAKWRKNSLARTASIAKLKGVEDSMLGSIETINTAEHLFSPLRPSMDTRHQWH